MFTFAYNLNGDSSVVIKDYPVATGYTPKKGDLVYLNGSGQITNAAINTATLLGVLSDTNFVGLVASGQPYAAATVSGTINNGAVKGKVYLDASLVYRATVKTGSGTPVAGTQYAVAIVSNDYQLDVANTAGSTKFATCVDYDPTTGNAFVVLDVNRQIA